MAAQRLGLDPRCLRRFRWLTKATLVRRNRASLRRNLRFVLFDPDPHNCTYEITNEAELVGMGTHALADMCRDHGLAYVEFHELPAHHFHPGAVLAAARSVAL